MSLPPTPPSFRRLDRGILNRQAREGAAIGTPSALVINEVSVLVTSRTCNVTSVHGRTQQPLVQAQKRTASEPC